MFIARGTPHFRAPSEEREAFVRVKGSARSRSSELLKSLESWL